jgi:hypothetical protein
MEEVLTPDNQRMTVSDRARELLEGREGTTRLQQGRTGCGT